MPLKFVFLALCLANVGLISAVRYPQYEDHPARRQSHHPETTGRQSQGNTKSPQLDFPSKIEGDNHFGDWLKRRFDSIGSNGGLRRFQKGTHTLRRNNDKHDKLVVNKKITQRQNCHPIGKNDKEKHLRRKSDSVERILDLNLKDVDKQIQQLVRIRNFRKFQKALNSVIVDDSIDSGIDDTDEYNKHWVTDDDSDEANSESSDESVEENNDHNNDDDGSSGSDDDVDDYDDDGDDNEKVA